MKDIIYIRWLNAFRGKYIPVSKSIDFETHRIDEAVCEPVKANKNGFYKTNIGSYKVQVGLIISEDKIFRRFKRDCWSEVKNGRLIATKPSDKNARHAEAWAKMNNAVKGIVVFDGLQQLSKEDYHSVINASKKYNLPVCILTSKGVLKM